MKKNIGPTDKSIRLVIGIAMIMAGVYYKNWLGALGILPLVTALTGFCGLYQMLGITTCKTEGPK